jgi:hypothetical protein
MFESAPPVPRFPGMSGILPVIAQMADERDADLLIIDTDPAGLTWCCRREGGIHASTHTGIAPSVTIDVQEQRGCVQEWAGRG